MAKIEDRVSTLESGSVVIREHIAAIHTSLKHTRTIVLIILTFVLGSGAFVAGVYNRIGRIEAMIEAYMHTPASLEVVVEE